MSGGNINLSLQTRKSKVMCNLIKNNDLNAQLERFWTIINFLTRDRYSRMIQLNYTLNNLQVAMNEYKELGHMREVSPAN